MAGGGDGGHGAVAEAVVVVAADGVDPRSWSAARGGCVARSRASESVESVVAKTPIAHDGILVRERVAILAFC